MSIDKKDKSKEELLKEEKEKAKDKAEDDKGNAEDALERNKKGDNKTKEDIQDAFE